jgi:hypothetical protein
VVDAAVIFGLIFALFSIFYFGSGRILISSRSSPSRYNVPITIMVLSVMLCIWPRIRRAAGKRIRARRTGLPLLEEDRDDKVLVWPDLVYTELICLILATAGLTGVGHRVKAPRGTTANPGYAPNPAKGAVVLPGPSRKCWSTSIRGWPASSIPG